MREGNNCHPSNISLKISVSDFLHLTSSIFTSVVLIKEMLVLFNSDLWVSNKSVSGAEDSINKLKG